jgi:gluconolactonase
VNNAVWDVTKSLPAESLMRIEQFEAFVHGLDHPEGVAAGPNGELYAGGEAGQIYRVGLDGTVTEVANTGGFLLGLCLDAESNVYVCDLTGHCLHRVTPSGDGAIYSSGIPGRPMRTPNYPVFDAAGNLYVSDSGSWKGNDGCVFVVRPDGTTELFTDRVSNFPNGMALHPGGQWLYVVESLVPAIVRVAIMVDGTAGAAETVVELPHNVPDGIAFDEAGDLYIGCYTPDVIYRYSITNGLQVLASDWESVTFATPTNIAFCGPDRRTLVVASLSRWHLTKGDMPVTGAKLHYPRLGGR